MIVCSCNAISETKIRDSVHSDKCPRTPGAVYRCLGCSPNCGRCYATVQAIIKDALGQAEAFAQGRESRVDELTITPLDHLREGHPHGACPAGCECCAARTQQAHG